MSTTAIRVSAEAYRRLKLLGSKEGRTMTVVVDRLLGVPAAPSEDGPVEPVQVQAKARVAAVKRLARQTRQEPGPDAPVRDTTSVPLATLSDEELRELERRLPDQRPTVTRQRPELLPVGPGPGHLGPTTPRPDPDALQGQLCKYCGHTRWAHGTLGCFGTCACSQKRFRPVG
jgi:hypothetical protein